MNNENILSNDNFRILKANDYSGFFANMLQTISLLMQVEKLSLKYKILIDWNNILYRSDNRKNNVWEYYFQQLHPYDVEEAYKNGVPLLKVKEFYPSYINDEIRKKSFFVINKYVKIKEEFNCKMNNFLKNFENKKVIGVHVRRTDHIQDSPYTKNEIYFQNIDRYSKEYGLNHIFLCSDEEKVINEFKEKYKNRIITYPSTRSFDSKSIHHQLNFDGYKKGEDVLIEAISLSKTEFLIRTRSNVSHFSLCYNPNLKFITIG